MSEWSWSHFFVVAALWNLVIAVPIIVAPDWSYSLAYPAEGASDAVFVVAFLVFLLRIPDCPVEASGA